MRQAKADTDLVEKVRSDINKAAGDHACGPSHGRRRSSVREGVQLGRARRGDSAKMAVSALSVAEGAPSRVFQNLPVKKNLMSQLKLGVKTGGDGASSRARDSLM